MRINPRRFYEFFFFLLLCMCLTFIYLRNIWGQDGKPDLLGSHHRCEGLGWSAIDTGLAPVAEDAVITLSTCSGSGNSTC